MTAHQSSSPLAPERLRTRRPLYSVATGRALALLVAVAACHQDRILVPRDHVATVADAIVSNPVPSSVNAAPSGAAASDPDLVVYVSLPPGSLTNGEQVTIRNRQSSANVSVVMLNGGFDPVAVGAVAGDTLDLEFRLAGSVSSMHVSHVVPLRSGPVVVRTDPPPKKRDVPLNAMMLVVFSEPINAAALTGSSVQLLRGGAPVAGTLRFGDSEQLALTFTSDEPLVPGAEYTLLVTQAISDLEGDALAEELRIDFTTATTSAAGAWVQVSAGFGHTCAVTTGGIAYCWGSNLYGELGIGSTNNKTPFPTRVAGGLSFEQVSAGAARSCGVTTAGALYCWGWNSDGELGDGTLVDRNTPTRVAGIVTFAQVSVGRSLSHPPMSALATSGVPYCWPICWGFPAWVTYQPAPTPSGLFYTQVSAGGDHSCGVTTDNAAYCWGNNFRGEFGDGTIDSVGPSPERPVAGGLDFVQVSAGERYTCGVTTDNVGYCWGDNGGRLGDGTTDRRLTPTRVEGNLRFTQVSTGGGHSCGVTTDHVAYCWGSNSDAWARGMLGDGTTEDRLTPTPVAGGIKFRQVSAGDNHTCGVTTDGSLYCWGFNPSGQLGSQFGYGTGGSRLTPTLVELPN